MSVKQTRNSMAESGGAAYPFTHDSGSGAPHLEQRDIAATEHVVIGVIASVTESVLAQCLLRLHARCPNAEIAVAEGCSTTLVEAVAAGRLDAALVNEQQAQLPLDSRLLFEEDMVLATSATHGPVLPHVVDLALLAQLELALPTERHGLRSALDAALLRTQRCFAPRFEFDVLSTMLKFVEASRFATVLPRIVVERVARPGALRVHSILGPRIERRIVGVSHPCRPLSVAAHTLFAIVADALHEVSSSDRMSAALAPAACAGA